MKSLPLISLCSAALLSAVACSKVPEGVIAPDDMARLMADVHTGEAVIEINRSSYMTDSLKQTVKQSVFMRHGVTSEQFDSSLAWYGRHIDVYMEVYDATIELLEHRLLETGNSIAAENALSIAGDSVDVWPNSRYVSITDRLPSKLISFNFGRDYNWQKGDSYTWRAKFFNSVDNSEWLMGVEYADGGAEWCTSSATGVGWKDISFQTDSSRQATRIFGYLSAVNEPGRPMRVDSISLVRRRLNRDTYKRSYAISLKNYNEPVEIADSVAND